MPHPSGVEGYPAKHLRLWTFRADAYEVNPSPRKLRFLKQVAPKMGDEAAEYSWKLAQVRLLRIPIIALALLAIIFQSLIPIVPLVVIGIVTIIATQANFTKMNIAASRTLGVPSED